MSLAVVKDFAVQFLCGKRSHLKLKAGILIDPLLLARAAARHKEPFSAGIKWTAGKPAPSLLVLLDCGMGSGD